MDVREESPTSSQPDGPSYPPSGVGIVGPTTHGAPSCDICGRRDETLRAMIIPYVFSLLVVTMRRAWTGVYCWRHRIQRLLAAGLISSLTGWWGIPWGFIYTPLTLVKLVRGGEIPEDENVELLARVAVQKLNAGEPSDAIKVFQEALRIKEDERTRNSLLQLQAKYPLSVELKDKRVPYWYVVSLLGASMVGISLGLLDYIITLFLGWVVGEETYLLLAILTWAPFVAMLYTGALILNEALQWIFARAGTDHLLMAIIFGLGFGGLLWYGIPQGYLIGDYAAAIMNDLGFSSVGDFILTTGAVITQGGIWFVLDSIESGLLGDVIYLILWSIAGLLFAWLAIRAAQESVHWRVRLELLQGDLRLEEPKSQLPAWGALGGFAFFLLLGFGIFAGQGRLLRGGPDLVAAIERGDEHYNAGEFELAGEAYRQAILAAPNQAGPHDSLGWVLYSMGNMEEATFEFGRAMELDPEWADPHIGMAYIHLSTGENEIARQDFETALQLANEPYYLAQAYYGLGNLAHQQDDLDTAIAYYEQAVREDWELSIAHMDMAIAYYAMAEYPRAIEHATDIIGLAPDWGAPHALLALSNFQLDQQEAMQRELDWAEDLPSDDIYSQLLLADAYWGLEQYDEAATVLQRAKLLYPENIQVPLLLARLAALKENFEEANALIDEQLEFDPSLLDAYLARAWVKIENQDLGQAEEALNQALEIDPDSWEAHNLRSFVYFHQGRIDESYIEADRAIQLYAYESSCFVHRAFAARAQGKLELAYADAVHAIELAPKLDMAHFIKGVVHLDLGETEQGVASLSIFLELARDRAFVRDYVQQAQAVLDQISIDQ